MNINKKMKSFSRNKLPALVIIPVLVVTAVLVFTFSPTARAGIESILTFNDVTVSVDQETGKLVVEGNMDAVVEQTDNSVTIKGEDGEEAGAGIAAAQAVEAVNVNDLLARHPDLVLPIVPDDYLLLPEGKSEGNNLTFTWKDSHGNLIMYQRSPAVIPGEQPTATASLSTIKISSGSGFISFDGYSGPMITYNWETSGFLHELIITDTSLSEANLQAMLP